MSGLEPSEGGRTADAELATPPVPASDTKASTDPTMNAQSSQQSSLSGTATGPTPSANTSAIHELKGADAVSPALLDAAQQLVLPYQVHSMVSNLTHQCNERFQAYDQHLTRIFERDKQVQGELSQLHAAVAHLEGALESVTTAVAGTSDPSTPLNQSDVLNNSDLGNSSSSEGGSVAPPIARVLEERTRSAEQAAARLGETILHQMAADQAEVDSKFNQIEDRVAELTNSVHDLRANVTSHNQALHGCESALTEIKQRVHHLETSTHDSTQRLSQFNDRLDESCRRLGNLEEQLDKKENKSRQEWKAALEEVQHTLGKHETALGEERTRTNEDRQRIAACESAGHKDRERISAVEDALENGRKRITACELGLDEERQRARIREATITENQTRLAACETGIEETRQRLRLHESVANDKAEVLQSKVSELEKMVEKIAAAREMKRRSQRPAQSRVGPSGTTRLHQTDESTSSSTTDSARGLSTTPDTSDAVGFDVSLPHDSYADLDTDASISNGRLQSSSATSNRTGQSRPKAKRKQSNQKKLSVFAMQMNYRMKLLKTNFNHEVRALRTELAHLKEQQQRDQEPRMVLSAPQAVSPQPPATINISASPQPPSGSSMSSPATPSHEATLGEKLQLIEHLSTRVSQLAIQSQTNQQILEQLELTVAGVKQQVSNLQRSQQRGQYSGESDHAVQEELLQRLDTLESEVQRNRAQCRELLTASREVQSVLRAQSTQAQAIEEKLRDQAQNQSQFALDCQTQLSQLQQRQQQFVKQQIEQLQAQVIKHESEISHLNMNVMALEQHQQHVKSHLLRLATTQRDLDDVTSRAPKPLRHQTDEVVILPPVQLGEETGFSRRAAADPHMVEQVAQLEQKLRTEIAQTSEIQAQRLQQIQAEQQALDAHAQQRIADFAKAFQEKLEQLSEKQSMALDAMSERAHARTAALVQELADEHSKRLREELSAYKDITDVHTRDLEQIRSQLVELSKLEQAQHRNGEEDEAPTATVLQALAEVSAHSLEPVHNRVATLQSALERLQDRLTTLSEGFSSVENALRTDIQCLDDKLQALEESIKSIQPKNDDDEEARVDQRLEAYDTRLSNMLDVQRTAAEAMNAMQHRVDEFATILQQSEQNYQSLHETVSAYENKLKELSQRLDSFEPLSSGPQIAIAPTQGSSNHQRQNPEMHPETTREPVAAVSPSDARLGNELQGLLAQFLEESKKTREQPRDQDNREASISRDRERSEKEGKLEELVEKLVHSMESRQEREHQGKPQEAQELALQVADLKGQLQGLLQTLVAKNSTNGGGNDANAHLTSMLMALLQQREKESEHTGVQQVLQAIMHQQVMDREHFQHQLQLQQQQNQQQLLFAASLLPLHRGYTNEQLPSLGWRSSAPAALSYLGPLDKAQSPMANYQVEVDAVDVDSSLPDDAATRIPVSRKPAQVDKPELSTSQQGQTHEGKAEVAADAATLSQLVNRAVHQALSHVDQTLRTDVEQRLQVLRAEVMKLQETTSQQQRTLQQQQDQLKDIVADNAKNTKFAEIAEAALTSKPALQVSIPPPTASPPVVVSPRHDADSTHALAERRDSLLKRELALDIEKALQTLEQRNEAIVESRMAQLSEQHEALRDQLHAIMLKLEQQQGQEVQLQPRQGSSHEQSAPQQFPSTDPSLAKRHDDLMSSIEALANAMLRTQRPLASPATSESSSGESSMMSNVVPASNTHAVPAPSPVSVFVQLPGFANLNPTAIGTSTGLPVTQMVDRDPSASGEGSARVIQDLAQLESTIRNELRGMKESIADLSQASERYGKQLNELARAAERKADHRELENLQLQLERLEQDRQRLQNSLQKHEQNQGHLQHQIQNISEESTRMLQKQERVTQHIQAEIARMQRSEDLAQQAILQLQQHTQGYDTKLQKQEQQLQDLNHQVHTLELRTSSVVAPTASVEPIPSNAKSSNDLALHEGLHDLQGRVHALEARMIEVPLSAERERQLMRERVEIQRSIMEAEAKLGALEKDQMTMAAQLSKLTTTIRSERKARRRTIQVLRPPVTPRSETTTRVNPTNEGANEVRPTGSSQPEEAHNASESSRSSPLLSPTTPTMTPSRAAPAQSPQDVTATPAKSEVLQLSVPASIMESGKVSIHLTSNLTSDEIVRAAGFEPAPLRASPVAELQYEGPMHPEGASGGKRRPENVSIVRDSDVEQDDIYERAQRTSTSPPALKRIAPEVVDLAPEIKRIVATSAPGIIVKRVLPGLVKEVGKELEKARNELQDELSSLKQELSQVKMSLADHVQHCAASSRTENGGHANEKRETPQPDLMPLELRISKAEDEINAIRHRGLAALTRRVEKVENTANQAYVQAQAAAKQAEMVQQFQVQMQQSSLEMQGQLLNAVATNALGAPRPGNDKPERSHPQEVSPEVGCELVAPSSKRGSPDDLSPRSLMCKLEEMDERTNKVFEALNPPHDSQPEVAPKTVHFRTVEQDTSDSGLLEEYAAIAVKLHDRVHDTASIHGSEQDRPQSHNSESERVATLQKLLVETNAKLARHERLTHDLQEQHKQECAQLRGELQARIQTALDERMQELNEQLDAQLRAQRQKQAAQQQMQNELLQRLATTASRSASPSPSPPPQPQPQPRPARRAEGATTRRVAWQRVFVTPAPSSVCDSHSKDEQHNDLVLIASEQRGCLQPTPELARALGIPFEALERMRLSGRRSSSSSASELGSSQKDIDEQAERPTISGQIVNDNPTDGQEPNEDCPQDAEEGIAGTQLPSDVHHQQLVSKPRPPRTRLPYAPFMHNLPEAGPWPPARKRTTRSGRMATGSAATKERMIEHGAMLLAKENRSSQPKQAGSVSSAADHVRTASVPIEVSVEEDMELARSRRGTQVVRTGVIHLSSEPKLAYPQHARQLADRVIANEEARARKQQEQKELEANLRAALRSQVEGNHITGGSHRSTSADSAASRGRPAWRDPGPSAFVPERVPDLRSRTFGHSNRSESPDKARSASTPSQRPTVSEPDAWKTTAPSAYSDGARIALDPAVTQPQIDHPRFPPTSILGLKSLVSEDPEANAHSVCHQEAALIDYLHSARI